MGMCDLPAYIYLCTPRKSANLLLRISQNERWSLVTMRVLGIKLWSRKSS